MNERVKVQFKVNGESTCLDVDPGDILVDVLRDRLSLTSARETCGVGVCGTCTVHVDGIPLSSCLSFASRLDGTEIVTAEGKFLEDDNNAVRRAFEEAEAFQCSYCTPGMAMMVSSYVESDERGRIPLEEYLVGNLCRCGSYQRVREAVAMAIQYRNRDQSESH